MAGRDGGDDDRPSESRMVVPLNTWILISNLKLAYNLLRRKDGTFNRTLSEFLDRKSPPNTNPVDGVYSFDVIVDRGTNLLVRVFRPVDPEVGSPSFMDLHRPSSADVVPVIVFFHGGSFAHSSANSSIYDVLCRRLVSLCGAILISVDYRRAPENPYPCPYVDGWTALEWVNSRLWLRSKKDSKVHIYLAGDSSGGNIIHNVALRAMGSEIEVLGNIMLNPMFGAEERSESEIELDGKYFVTIKDRDWYWRAFLPEDDRDHPACNPFGPKGISIEGKNFPRSLVAVAGLNLTRDMQVAYAEELGKTGCEVKLVYLEMATVGFYLLPNNDNYFTLMDEIKRFVSSETCEENVECST